MFDNLTGHSFCLNCENFLYSKAKSEDKEIREQAILKIHLLRQMKPPPKRSKNILPINFEATNCTELVDISTAEGLTEPALTGNISNKDHEASLLNGTELELPCLPSHSQSVERAVKLVSEAGRRVLGLKKYYEHILTRIFSRRMRPAFESKGKYNQEYDILRIRYYSQYPFLLKSVIPKLCLFCFFLNIN